MRSPAHRQILTCLALLALGWAQVFGMMRGYVCDCGGEIEISAYDHCHGPHGVSCHHDGEVAHDHEDAPLHHHDDADSDTHEHEALKESVKAKQISLLGSQAPLPVMAVIAVLEPLTMQLAFAETSSSHVEPPKNGDLRRRWASLITHTIALRI